MNIFTKIGKSIPTISQIRNYNVAVFGGANEVGQTVCLLLKSDPAVSKLTLHDNDEQTAGVALDLSHIPTETVTKCYMGERTMLTALATADIVLAIGEPHHQPGVDAKIVYSRNSDFIKALCLKIGRRSMPFLGIVTEPLNHMVPIASEILKGNGFYDPRKLFGITSMDTLRAQALYASELRMCPCECYVPVIGGHSEKTMIPLFSKSTPPCRLSSSKIHELTTILRNADSIIKKAKSGYSPSLSTAYCAVMFVKQIMNAMDGYPAHVHALVENNDFGTSFFSGHVTLNQHGAHELERFTNLSQYEFQLLEHSIIEMRKDIREGRKVLESFYEN